MPQEDLREFAQIIGRNGRRLLRVVEALLRLGEIHKGEIVANPDVVDVGSLARQASEAAQLEGRDVRVTIDAEAGQITADGQFLREILHHAVDNAVKFTSPDSGIEILVQRHDERVVFHVVDHGPGIPEPERLRAFGDFEQLDGSTTRQQGGLGAGLYIARALVESHGGTISINDTPGGGTTIRFMIPQPDPD